MLALHDRVEHQACPARFRRRVEHLREFRGHRQRPLFVALLRALADAKDKKRPDRSTHSCRSSVQSSARASRRRRPLHHSRARATPRFDGRPVLRASGEGDLGSARSLHSGRATSGTLASIRSRSSAVIARPFIDAVRVGIVIEGNSMIIPSFFAHLSTDCR